jgi:hypothetical protein
VTAADELVFRIDAIARDLRVRLPELVYEKADAWKLISLSRRLNIDIRCLADVKTRQEAEDRISALERHVMHAYAAEDLCQYVRVRLAEKGAGKAVHVTVDVTQGNTRGTSSFDVPRAWLVRHGKGFVLPRWQVVQNLARNSGEPAQILWLPGADWHRFFASLRSQLPADFEGEVLARVEHTEKLAAQAHAFIQSVEEEECNRDRLARAAAERLAAEERAQRAAEKAARETVRRPAPAVVAVNATVSGRHWVGPRESKHTEVWTLRGATVKQSGNRAYIYLADGRFFGWKTIDKIQIAAEPSDAAPGGVV